VRDIGSPEEFTPFKYGLTSHHYGWDDFVLV
jgi:hypothetical protein